MRIARGPIQGELAERLGVNESMVSRDGRNEYHEITVDRAVRIVGAMGGRLVKRVAYFNSRPDASPIPIDL